MITQYPSKEEMNNFKTELMPGEKSIINKLVNFFQNKKDRNVEIYIQPNINGLHPDIIVLEKNCKVWIVEVKDYHLKHYNITKNGWQLKRDNNVYQKFPFRQVSNYKRCFYELLCPELAIRLVQDEKNYGLIKNVVYFHNITKNKDLKKQGTKVFIR
ncbi:nuclease-related domain-containing protein [Candidatus Ruminimicrobium bovinum]|uniref:nuclease-related domain-containing protein n=1 Tax=Candidatus Ruminimicrobium bovinum TaxID=3242779 RepID=UPI0039B992D0